MHGTPQKAVTRTDQTTPQACWGVGAHTWEGPSSQTTAGKTGILHHTLEVSLGQVSPCFKTKLQQNQNLYHISTVILMLYGKPQILNKY